MLPASSLSKVTVPLAGFGNIRTLFGAISVTLLLKPHGKQLPQHTAGMMVSPLMINTRFVNCVLPLVHGAVGSLVSCPPQLSCENLYSIVSPSGMLMVICQMSSLLASVIGAQLPHQLLKVPLISGVVKVPVNSFMSTLKVTLAVVGVAAHGEQEPQHTTPKVVAALGTTSTRLVNWALPLVHDSAGLFVS